MIHERHTCRACGSRQLLDVLDLGKTALANDFLDPSEVATYQAVLPLRLRLCGQCSLLQLAAVVDPGVLYSRYAYVTSTSRTMDAHLEEQCRHLLATGEFGPSPRVLEIASNTGRYLKKFQARGCEVLGVEPARNIAELAEQSDVPTWIDFFNSSNAPQICHEWGRADLVLGRHVLAHIDDWLDLFAGLEAITHERSVVAFEVPYLVDFLDRTEFDTIYHEHLSYVSVGAIQALLARTPFYLQRVDHYPIHGGSILLQLRHRAPGSPCGIVGGAALGEAGRIIPQGEAAHESVAAYLQREGVSRLAEPATWERFARQVRHIQTRLPELIRDLRGRGKRVIGYGASAKGSTLLNTCGLNAHDLDYIIDNTPFKQNKVAPGSWIPIRPPEVLLQDQPDYALLLAWNFAPEIVGREVEYQRRGGRFIVPIPEPKIVEFASG